MIVFIFLYLTLLFPIISALEGPNVCSKFESKLVEVRIPKKVPHEARTFIWCFSKIRCPKKKIEYRDGFVTENVIQKVKKEVCCKGYAEVSEKCIPICSIPCVHGICIAPELCSCQLGWTGSTCNITCPKKDIQCNQTCECGTNGKCNLDTKRCDCNSGWSGEFCSLPCPFGFYGLNCKHQCKCQNNAKCDTFTGVCKCEQGFKGEFCEINCSDEEECQSDCSCLNGGKCDESGVCKCKPGFSGPFCDENCSEKTYGQDCKHICNCNDLSYCDPVKGCVIKPPAIQPSGLYYHDSPNNSNIIIVSMICSLLVTLVIVLALLLYFRRNMKKFTEEFAYVTYATGNNSTDRFDNLVYAFQNSPVKLAAPSCSSSSSISKFQSFKNNLSFNKNNLEKQFYGSNEPRSLNIEACSSDVILNSKLDSNPNIYVDPHDIKYSISKNDPLYDEIRCKDDELPEDYYDRPRFSSKVNNYETIDNTFKRS